ncbi:hypothetical protein LTR16_000199 [Cryomyces antarcticus]|uniref:SANT domain-containing protein n=1 Tax=Cryomyces antarcticus TaxID=329879 RepID=A0ABR0KWQ7_9PEZI|nr:hypothetical protein LTR39_000423 [Cryomyces antarcticus]KAK5021055.1 hypothetical protein LTR60_000134 [Cryomyces antarcticus]KAK5131978.1 hypothetical protein LTR16_000199 [Cryomyces antarcticus]
MTRPKNVRKAKPNTRVLEAGLRTPLGLQQESLNETQAFVAKRAVKPTSNEAHSNDSNPEDRATAVAGTKRRSSLLQDDSQPTKRLRYNSRSPSPEARSITSTSSKLTSVPPMGSDAMDIDSPNLSAKDEASDSERKPITMDPTFKKSLDDLLKKPFSNDELLFDEVLRSTEGCANTNLQGLSKDEALERLLNAVKNGEYVIKDLRIEDLPKNWRKGQDTTMKMFKAALRSRAAGISNLYRPDGAADIPEQVYERPRKRPHSADDEANVPEFDGPLHKQRYSPDGDASIPELNKPPRMQLITQKGSNEVDPRKLTAAFAFKPPTDTFTTEEHAIFVREFQRHFSDDAKKGNPKDFGRIARALPGRTPEDCVYHYYATKWNGQYKEHKVRRLTLSFHNIPTNMQKASPRLPTPEPVLNCTSSKPMSSSGTDTAIPATLMADIAADILTPPMRNLNLNPSTAGSKSRREPKTTRTHSRWTAAAPGATISTDRSLLIKGFPEPDRLTITLFDIRSSTVKTFTYKVPAAEVNWNDGTAISAINTWTATTWLKCTGEKIRTVPPAYEKVEKDWIVELYRREPSISFSALTKRFNAQFAGQMLTGYKVPRSARTESSLWHFVVNRRLKEEAKRLNGGDEMATGEDDIMAD